MKERVEVLVRQFRDARRHRLRFGAAVTALSVLVTGSVFWQLRREGSAFADAQAAGAAELPGFENSVIETDADPPDLQTDTGVAETPEDWEATLPEFSGESPQQRLAAVAASQLGYTEKAGVELPDGGADRSGYTRYGAWYGNPYGEWNTMFTYFCMHYAEIDRETVPYGSGCWAWYEKLSGKDMITACGDEKPGDILFFDTDADGDPDRTGIVSGVSEAEEGVTLSVIEGNCEGAVAEKQYLRGSETIAGVLSPELYLTEDSADPSGEDEADGLVTYTAESASGIRVTAKAAEGVFPEDTVMYVNDVADDVAMQAAQSTLGNNAPIRGAVAVDISFRTAEDTEIEPQEGNPVTVQIQLPEEKQLADGALTLLHIDDEGTGEIVADAEITSDSAAFDAESFSVYVMTAAGPPPTYSEYTDDTYTAIAGEHFTFYEDVPAGYYDGTADGTRHLFWTDNNWQGADASVGWQSVVSPNIYENGGTWYGLNSTYTVTPLEGGMERHTVEFTASDRIGRSVVIHSPSEKTIRVIIWPIMVNSSHGPRDVDRIREWLGAYEDGTTYGIDFPDFWHMTDIDGYVPNSERKPFQYQINQEAPYDVLTFYIDSFNAYDPNNAFTITATGDTPPNYTVVSCERTDNLPNGKHRYTVNLKLTSAGSSNGRIHAVFRENTNIDFWIDPWESKLLNHADMEIADGGTYTVSSTRVVGGKTYVDVEVYQGDVTFVNDAFIYDSEGTVLQHFTSEFDPQHPVYGVLCERDAEGRPILDENGTPLYILDSDGHKQPDYSIKIGDYEQFGQLGGTQYEYTSAWIHNSLKGNQKTFQSDLADHATFNVKLMLTPKKKYTYVIESDGTVTLQSANEDWKGNNPEKPGEMIPVDDITFIMDHQDVIDAINKCPNENGLDFTARAEYTVLQMPLQKMLKNGEIHDGDFIYDIVDLNGDDHLWTSSINSSYPIVRAEDLDENSATYEVSLPDLSVAARQEDYHKFVAYEIFDENGHWGQDIPDEDLGTGEGSLLYRLRKEVYDQVSRPFVFCSSDQDVFNLVCRGIRPPKSNLDPSDPDYDPNYNQNEPVADTELKAFYDFMSKYIEGIPVASIPKVGNYFSYGRQGYLMVTDQAVIAASTEVKADVNESDPTDKTKGTAILDGMRFVYREDGEPYHFAVHERVPANTNGVNYDNKIIRFDVVVEKVDGFLVAYPVILKEDGSGNWVKDPDKTDITFVNKIIRLPETGGTGTLPYLAGGSVLIASAWILSWVRRRKEDEPDA